MYAEVPLAVAFEQRFSPMVLAVLLSFFTILVVRRYLPKPDSVYSRSTVEEIVFRFCNAVIVYLLLPIMFTEAIVSNHDKLPEMGLGMLAGGLLPLFTLVFGAAAFSFGKLPQVHPWSHVVMSTFGGGNRGAVLLLLVCTLFALDQDKYFSYFYAVDFGNFVFFMYLIPLVVRRKGKLKLDGTPLPPTEPNYLLGFGVNNLFVIGASVLLILCPENNRNWFINEALSPSKDSRSFILLYLSFTSTLLKVGLRLPWGSMLSSLVFGMFMRVLSAALLVCVFGLGGVTDLNTLLHNPYALSLLVLIFCPPSSILPAVVERNSRDKKVQVFVSTISTVMMGLYVFSIFLLLALSWLRHAGFFH